MKINAELVKEKDMLKSQIDQFINKYDSEKDSKVDKGYILFLFQIYNYSDGVKKYCKKLDLKQDLINHYIKQNDSKMVMEVCKEETKPNSTTCGELWSQALTYFRDIEDVSIAEKNIIEALDFIKTFEKEKIF